LNPKIESLLVLEAGIQQLIKAILIVGSELVAAFHIGSNLDSRLD
jgi:hypothetical protein